MKKTLQKARLAALFASSLLGSMSFAQTPEAEPGPPIKFDTEISVTHAGDGGLRPAVGTHNIQVYRANRLDPVHQHDLNHTYSHAPNLAYWNGTFHLEYLSAPVSEHDSPTPTSYTSSKNGIHWQAPRLIFPAYELPDGSHPLTHQRMAFYVAPNGKLLATAFYGLYPRPNDGTGIGRAVREIKKDGSFGPIYYLRYNSHESWDPRNAEHFPFYTESNDNEFVKACEALLADKLMTAQWWEEDRSEDGFYREPGKALSYYHLPDGKVVGIWKNAVTTISEDEGESWVRTGFARNIPRNGSKYWLEKTKDDRYAMVFNPTSRLRHPLAIATSDDGENFSNLLAVHGEHADIRFWGKYKSMGPQYVRGILEGNGVTPDSYLWLTYSVNKEDIWVSRVSTPVKASAQTGATFDDFEKSNKDGLPANWNVYSPLWASPRVIDTQSERGAVLELNDEDPYDYASVTRVFEQGRSSLIRFKLLARQVYGRLEIDVASGDGLRPVQIAFTEDGTIESKHEGAWKPGGTYRPDEWMDVELDVNPGKNHERFQLRINGEEVLYRIAYFSDFPSTTERLTFRTGSYRQRGKGGIDLPNPDFKTPNSIFLIDDVSIEPNRQIEP